MKSVLNDEIRELLRDREKIMKELDTLTAKDDFITIKMGLDFINNDIANACSNMFAKEDKS